ncbi:hypothetical protein D3C85_1594150 [compost metagenome]
MRIGSEHELLCNRRQIKLCFVADIGDYRIINRSFLKFHTPGLELFQLRKLGLFVLERRDKSGEILITGVLDHPFHKGLRCINILAVFGNGIEEVRAQCR